MPTWAVYGIAFGTPTLAFIGAFAGHLLGRKTAGELETRSKREETMRTLRWAAELAVDDDERKANLGFRQLVACRTLSCWTRNRTCSWTLHWTARSVSPFPKCRRSKPTATSLRSRSLTLTADRSGCTLDPDGIE